MPLRVVRLPLACRWKDKCFLFLGITVVIVPYNKPRYVILHVAWGFVGIFDNVLLLPSGTFDVLNLCIVICRCGLNNILQHRLSAPCYLWVWSQ